jgi:hypothetical protein
MQYHTISYVSVTVNCIFAGLGVAVKWLIFLLYIQEVLGSNLGSKTSYAEVFMVSPCKCWDSNLN